MRYGSAIEWTDATWNPVTGCSVVSPGCTNCYAMKLAGSWPVLARHPSRIGLTRDSKAGPVWTGEVRFNEGWLDQPLRWRRPRRIFVCAHGDLFHEAVPDEWIDRVFAVMALCPRHVFQVLTKRPERMRAWFDNPERAERVWREVYRLCEEWHDGRLPVMLRVVDDDPYLYALGSQGAAWGGQKPWPLPKVWLGTSVEDHARADERIPHLLATPAAVRWLSCEPLLGPLDPTRICPWGEIDFEPVGPALDGFKRMRIVVDALRGAPSISFGKIDWIVAGGESGRGARPMHPDWVLSLRDQCAAAGVPFFFKQHGEWIGVPDLRRLPGGEGPGFGAFDHCRYDMDAEAVRVGKKRAGRLLDGVEHNAMPQVPA